MAMNSSIAGINPGNQARVGGANPGLNNEARRQAAQFNSAKRSSGSQGLGGMPSLSQNFQKAAKYAKANIIYPLGTCWRNAANEVVGFFRINLNGLRSAFSPDLSF